MTHAALVGDALFLTVVILTLLLAMFLYAVIVMPAENAVPARPPPLPPSARDRQQLWTTPGGAGTTGPSGGARFAGRRADAVWLWRDEVHRPDVSSAPPWDLEPSEHEVIHWPRVSGKPPWEPAPKPSGIP